MTNNKDFAFSNEKNSYEKKLLNEYKGGHSDYRHVSNPISQNWNYSDYYSNEIQSNRRMKEIVVHSGIHQLNDAKLAMKLTDKYLETIEEKLTDIEIVASQMHNTDTFSVFDGSVRDISKTLNDIDSVIDMARYNGKCLLINSSITSHNKLRSNLRTNVSNLLRPIYNLKWNKSN